MMCVFIYLGASDLILYRHLAARITDAITEANLAVDVADTYHYEAADGTEKTYYQPFYEKKSAYDAYRTTLCSSLSLTENAYDPALMDAAEGAYYKDFKIEELWICYLSSDGRFYRSYIVKDGNQTAYNDSSYNDLPLSGTDLKVRYKTAGGGYKNFDVDTVTVFSRISFDVHVKDIKWTDSEPTWQHFEKEHIVKLNSGN